MRTKPRVEVHRPRRLNTKAASETERLEKGVFRLEHVGIILEHLPFALGTIGVHELGWMLPCLGITTMGVVYFILHFVDIIWEDEA